MNLFQATGTVIQSLTNSTVKILGTFDKSLDVVDNVVEVGKLSTQQMVKQAEHDNKRFDIQMEDAEHELELLMAERQKDKEAVEVQKS